jgi:hypothetical protein
MCKSLLVAAVFGFFLLGSAKMHDTAIPAAGEDKQPSPAKSYAATYDVADVVAKRSYWDVGGKRVPVSSGLTQYLLSALIADSPTTADKWLGKKAVWHIQMVNGKKLEVHADKKTHATVKNLLEAMRRSLDLAVIVESHLFEVDRKVYEQQIKGKLHQHPGNPPVFAEPATEEVEKKFLNDPPGKKEKPFYAGLKPLKTGKVTLQDREHGEIFSWRSAVPFERSPGGASVVKKGEKEISFAYPGFSFAISPVVTSDRRATHLKLTQNVTQLLEWQKVNVLELHPNQDLKSVAYEVPVLQESTFTSNFTVFDGWPVVATIQWQTPEAKKNDRVLVLLFTARILIEEEERQIQKLGQPKDKTK